MYHVNPDKSRHLGLYWVRCKCVPREPLRAEATVFYERKLPNVRVTCTNCDALCWTSMNRVSSTGFVVGEKYRSSYQ